MATKTNHQKNSDKDSSDKNVDPLHSERECIREAVKHIETFGLMSEANRKKNVKDSIKYRNKGNDLYKSSPHNAEKHQKILESYTQSIALAPNNSEELALGYGNRSALLYHLKKYKECLKDCDRALNLGRSDVLRAKLLCRKAECLKSLKDSSALNICEEASDLISKLTVVATIKNKYVKKLNNIKTVLSNNNFEEEDTEMIEECKELPSFVRQKEAPCASAAVAIKYSKKWGRHIVATILYYKKLILEKSLQLRNLIILLFIQMECIFIVQTVHNLLGRPFHVIAAFMEFTVQRNAEMMLGKNFTNLNVMYFHIYGILIRAWKPVHVVSGFCFVPFMKLVALKK